MAVRFLRNAWATRRSPLPIALLFLMAIPAWAVNYTYYVSKTGSNANTCTQARTASTAKLTIAAGMACLAAGDTLDIRTGTFAESIFRTIPSGTDDSNHTIVQGHTGETAIIRPSVGGADGDVIETYAQQYITLKNLTVDGINVSAFAISYRQASHHIVVDGCIVKNAPLGEINAARDQTTDRHHFTVINSTVGPVGAAGDGFDHTIYMRARDNLVANNFVFGSLGYGIRFDLPASGILASNNVVYGNRVYGNGQRGINMGGGANCLVYNNLIYNNTTPTVPTGPAVGGILIGSSASTSGTGVYNNTIYGNTGYCVWNYSDNTALIRNNICYSNSNNSISGSGTISNNLFTNPSFVNAGATDFHLVAGSTAIGTGFDLSAIFTMDYDGLTRIIPFDIGAYKYAGAASITVLVPNGGENWQIGTGQTLTWSSSGGVSGTVEIKADLDGSQTYGTTLITSTTNNGSYPWTVAGSANANCRIRVKDTAAATNDVSDAVFAISASVTETITVSFPVASMVMFPGQAVPINWTSVGISGNVKIELSRDDGATYPESISASFPFDGVSFSWTVPTIGVSSSTCKIKITSLNDPTVQGVSATFRIAGVYLLIR